MSARAAAASPATSRLEVMGLKKQYGARAVVQDVHLAVGAGEVVGLLGPNGAGKTTTIEILEGLSRPTSGEVRFRGEALGPGYRERVGIQFQSTALQDFLTVRENLNFFSALYEKRVPLDEVIQRCRLEEFLDRDTRKISGGQRQRVLLAIALVNDPEVLFLDEPTTGLDPQARRNFWELVRDIRARGKTILLTTHYMDEAYALCDDLLIMDHGKIIARGSPQRLLSDHFDDVVLELPGDAIGARELPFVLQKRGDNVEIMSADVNATIAALLAAEVSLAQLKVRPRSLEDLFLELTGKELRG